MLHFIAGLVLGALIGGLIYRNNATKAKKALDLLVAEAEEAKKALQTELEGLKAKIKPE